MLGIVGTVFGLTVFLFFIAFPCGVTAVVLGIVGLQRTKRPPPRRGRGMAMAGIVLGAIAAVLGIVGLIILMALGDSDSISADSESVVIDEVAMEDFVDDTMDSVFRTVSFEAMADRAAPELAAMSGFEFTFNSIADNPGPLVGDYTIVSIEPSRFDAPAGFDSPDGSLPGAVCTIRGDFEHGTSTLVLEVLDRDGGLQVIGFNIEYVDIEQPAEG